MLTFQCLINILTQRNNSLANVVLELASWTSLCPLAMQMEHWCMNSWSSLEKLGS